MPIAKGNLWHNGYRYIQTSNETVIYYIIVNKGIFMNINHIITQLQRQGFRITESRKEILALFIGVHTSLSAGEIVKELQNKTDRATVYRNLNFLINNGILKQIHLQGDVPKYELNDLGHHHHLVCTNCKAVSSISSDPLENILPEVENLAKKSDGFIIKDHVVEFYGICKNCA